MFASPTPSLRPITGWTDLLLVGNDTIDADHRKLFSLVNQVREGMLRTQGESSLRKVLDELMAYANEHFAREEKLMQEARYAEQEEHIVEHRLLTYRLRNLHYRHLNGDRGLNEQMEIFLDRWLARHIMTADLRLAESIRISAMLSNGTAIASGHR